MSGEKQEEKSPRVERRGRTLTDADIDALHNSFLPEDYFGVPISEHIEHHNIFRDWLIAQDKKKARIERYKTQVVGSLIVSSVGAVGTALYVAGNWVKDHIKW